MAVRCNDCGGKMKSKTNYPMGTKNKSYTSIKCKDCGSDEVNKDILNDKRRGKRR